MRIKRISLGGFGKFQDFNLDLNSGVSIIAGLNEAGKTTMVEAITSVLFGFSGPRKELFSLYAPWDDPKNYRASILIAASDGKEYLIGRDFNNGRVEVFRCDGFRMEAVQDGFLQHLIRTELGVTHPLLFEHALLFKEKDMSLLDRDYKSRNGLARLLGENMTGVGSGASWGEACTLLEEYQRERLARGEKERILQRIDDLKERLEKEELRFWRSLCAGNVLDDMDRALSETRSRVDKLKLRIENLESAETLKRQKSQLLERIQQLEAEEERLNRLREETQRRLENTVKETPVLTDEELNRCEEILGRLSVIEVEKRYRVEQSHEAQRSLEMLEKEADALKNKIRTIGEFNADTERQTQINALVYRLNEGQRAFLNLSKPSEPTKAKKPSGLLKNMLWIITVLGAFGVSAVYVYAMTPMIRMGSAAAELLIFCGAAIATWRHHSIKKSQLRQVEEMEAREEEIRSIQAQLHQLLGGKTYEEYQAENQLHRLHQNDLWHLENTIAQQRTMASLDDVKGLDDETSSLERELNSVLARVNAFGPAMWREAVERERYLRTLRDNKDIADDTNWESEIQDLRQEKSRLLAESQLIVIEDDEDGCLPELQNEYDALIQKIHALELERVEKASEGATLSEFGVLDSWEFVNLLAEEEARIKQLNDEDAALQLAINELRSCGGATEEAIGPQIERLAGEFLSTLTQGRYQELQLKTINDEFRVEVRASGTGAWVAPSCLSSGTTDQIYLAFRLALAETMTNAAEYLLLLDDPFVHFDNERLAESVALLKKIAEKHQIIWWSKDPESLKAFSGTEPVIIQ